MGACGSKQVSSGLWSFHAEDFSCRPSGKYDGYDIMYYI